MKWYEIAVYTTDAGIEPVCGALTGAGLSGFSIEESREAAAAFLDQSALYWDFADMAHIGTDAPCVKAYLAALPENKPLLDAARAAVKRLRGEDLGVDVGPLTVCVTVRDDEDWANSWKRYYEPIEVGERLLVLPSWKPRPRTRRTTLRLDPGLAFGTGAHHTTRMCLELLEAAVPQGGAMLDLGCFGMLIGQFVGSWGNFINREAYGAETEIFCRMGLTDPVTGNTIYVHPTFLYESLWNFLGFVLLHIFSKKFERRFDGQFFLMYVAWYGFGRMLIEGLRTDSLYIPGTAIRVSQLLGALSCAAAVIAFVIMWKRSDGKKLWKNRSAE